MKEGLDHGKGHGNFPTHKMFFLVKKEKKKKTFILDIYFQSIGISSGQHNLLQ